MGAFSILIMLLLGVIFAALAIGVGKILAVNRPGGIKGESYECGIPSEGNTISTSKMRKQSENR